VTKYTLFYSGDIVVDSKSIMLDLQAFVRNEVGLAHGTKTADACTKALTQCLALNFGRDNIYVPRLIKRKTEERDRAVIAEFNGHNHSNLAIKYNVSLQWIYAIIRKARTKSQAAKASNEPVLAFVIEEHLPPDLIRLGLSESEATALSRKIASYLAEKYPGVFFRVNSRATHEP
jgi:hypothetical protein